MKPLPEILEHTLNAVLALGPIEPETVRQLMLASYTTGRFDGMLQFHMAGRKREAASVAGRLTEISEEVRRG